MQPVSPSLGRTVISCFRGLLRSQSRPTAFNAELRTGKRTHGPTVFLVLAVLLSLSGCAGGFQGYRPVVPTVTQPGSVTVPVGDTATFSVTATGTGTMKYQWYKNGVAISGATSSAYTTPPTVAGDSGAVFTVTVSNSAGSATSGPATLTVLLPP